MPARCLLTIFAKYPTPGTVKTRLAADVGPEPACSIYRAIVQRTIQTAQQWVHNSPHEVCLYTADNQHDRWHNWLETDIPLHTQDGNDLGARMHNALSDGLATGYDATICLGTDVPGITSDHLNQAVSQLSRNDAVVGPSDDGGYYLIGIRRPAPELFSNINWSTNEVLAQTRQSARENDLELSTISPVNDIDTTEDLWGDAGPISIVIPTLNEESNIADIIRRGRHLGPHEIIVADGGSQDDTAAIARSTGANVVDAPRGRGRQMNAGAEVASGDTLFFLHADCQPAPLSLWHIGRAFSNPAVVGGAFELKLDRTTAWLKVVETTANWRSHLLGKPYGDQGMFVRKEVFQDVGGFPDWPLMEDVELARRLRAAGDLTIIPQPMLASARKWETGGILRTYLIMKLTLWGYHLGATPESLSRFYERGTRRKDATE